jgi:prepilin-type N-terminal cleavage/methylation domain-containing protein
VRTRSGQGGGVGDGGFTLIELLVAVVIMGVITVPLSNVVLDYLRHTDVTTGRLIESHDVQIASAYWAQDVSSLGVRSTTSPFALQQSVEVGVAYNAGLYPCGVAGTPSATVRLAWDDSGAPGAATVVRVAYVVQTVSGQTELHRLRCEGSAAVVSDVTIAHDLDSSAPPALTCPSTCTAAPAVPTAATLQLTLRDPENVDVAYPVALTGQRRQS